VISGTHIPSSINIRISARVVSCQEEVIDAIISHEDIFAGIVDHCRVRREACSGRFFCATRFAKGIFDLENMEIIY